MLDVLRLSGTEDLRQGCKSRVGACARVRRIGGQPATSIPVRHGGRRTKRHTAVEVTARTLKRGLAKFDLCANCAGIKQMRLVSDCLVATITRLD